MECTAAKSALLKELNLTQGVVEKKTTIPILSNLLLEVSDSTLRISATDLELGVRCGCSAKVKKEGSGTVPAKRDRKSTRLNSSHVRISYAVFCLKKKKRISHVELCLLKQSL